MNYSIEFFSPSVKAEILNWPDGILASFVRITEKIVSFGPHLGSPYTSSLGDGLFEIRAKGAVGIGRAFFCTLTGHRVVILHGFIKKSQKTPKKELALARKRLKEVQSV
jgi:phage-related protein